MRKFAKRVSAAVVAGAVLMSLTISASAEDQIYKESCRVTCSECKSITDATLDIKMRTAVATTSINSGTRGVTVSMYGDYYEKEIGVKKNTGNGNGWTAGVTTSISNGGGIWIQVTSRHSKCCHSDFITLNWSVKS